MEKSPEAFGNMPMESPNIDSKSMSQQEMKTNIEANLSAMTDGKTPPNLGEDYDVIAFDSNSLVKYTENMKTLLIKSSLDQLHANFGYPADICS